MNKVAVVLLVLLSIATITFSRVLYVSPFGSNDNNGLSSSSPLKTIKRAEFVASHGDVIQLATGFYQGPNNCIEFNSVNITLRGPARLDCPKGIKVNGVNFIASNITLSNLTISHADKVSISNSKITKGFSSVGVRKLNLTEINFSQITRVSSFASNFTCTNCTSNGELFIDVSTGGFECFSCKFPLGFINATRLSLFVTSNSTFSGISNSNMQARKGSAVPVCNITSTNITCEDSGYSGLSLYKANCTVSNSTIEHCSTVSNSTTNGTAINLVYSNSTFYNVTVQNNYGNSSVFVGAGSNFTMVNGSISNNWGNDTTKGAGVYVSSGAVAVIDNSTLAHNIAYIGGAFFVENKGKVYLTLTVIAHNTAFIAGNFACTGKSSVVLKDCTLSDNVSTSGVENNCSI